MGILTYEQCKIADILYNEDWRVARVAQIKQCKKHFENVAFEALNVLRATEYKGES
jgi:hypothetical protein